MSKSLQEQIELPPPLTDKKRLDFLESESKRSSTGISIQRIPKVDDEPSGWRFMRQHYIGNPHKSIRECIDTAIKELTK